MYIYDLASRTTDMAVMDQECCRAPFVNDRHRMVAAPWTDNGENRRWPFGRGKQQAPVALAGPFRLFL
jgi:hypothetical protein